MKSSVNIIVLFSAFALSSSSAKVNCPAKFDTVDGRCIFIGGISRFSSALPEEWTNARNNCTSYFNDDNDWKTDLAAPVDINFLQALRDYIVETIPNLAVNTFWVGASFVDRQWQWIDGTPISNRSYVWLVGHPMPHYEGANGLLFSPGIFNRFYMTGFASGTRGTDYICEAKRRA